MNVSVPGNQLGKKLRKRVVGKGSVTVIGILTHWEGFGESFSLPLQLQLTNYSNYSLTIAHHIGVNIISL